MPRWLLVLSGDGLWQGGRRWPPATMAGRPSKDDALRRSGSTSSVSTRTRTATSTAAGRLPIKPARASVRSIRARPGSAPGQRAPRPSPATALDLANATETWSHADGVVGTSLCSARRRKPRTPPSESRGGRLAVGADPVFPGDASTAAGLPAGRPRSALQGQSHRRRISPDPRHGRRRRSGSRDSPITAWSSSARSMKPIDAEDDCEARRWHDEAINAISCGADRNSVGRGRRSNCASRATATGVAAVAAETRSPRWRRRAGDPRRPATQGAIEYVADWYAGELLARSPASWTSADVLWEQARSNCEPTATRSSTPWLDARVAAVAPRPACRSEVTVMLHRLLAVSALLAAFAAAGVAAGPLVGIGLNTATVILESQAVRYNNAGEQVPLGQVQQFERSWRA